MRLPVVLFINQLMRKGKKTSVFQDEDEDFLYLMMFYPIASHKKAFVDSNHLSNINWPYMNFVYF